MTIWEVSGCNRSEHPGLHHFYRILERIRSRSDVQDVLVEIKELVDEQSWPFADTIFVVTSMDQHELKKLLAELKPDEVGQFLEAGISRTFQHCKTE